MTQDTENEVSSDVADEEGETPTTNPVEKEARAQGWIPEEEWKGDPEKWKPAEDFVNDGKKINAILQERMDKIIEDNTQIKSELQRKDDIIEKLVKYHEEDKKRAINSAIKDLKAKRKEAIEEGNADLVEELDTELQSHTKAQEELEAATQESSSQSTEPDPVFKEWKQANSWYGNDPEMTAEADIIGPMYAQSGHYSSKEEVLKAVTNRIKRLFPEKFKAAPAPSVEEGGHGTAAAPSAKRQTYANLPPEAKAACDKYVQQKIMTRDDYVKIYYANNAE